MARVRHFDRRRRVPLADWQIRATAPGAAARPSDLDPSGGWLACRGAQTVAAALRDAGVWSLDGSPRRFDAEDWWYRTEFEAPSSPASSRVSMALTFGGLATVTEAWLNGEALFTGDSMFVAQRIAVDGRLAAGRNQLVLCFRSLDALLRQRRGRARWRAPMVEHPQLRWFRTTLLGRTPGWSPPAAPVGLSGDVALEIADGIELAIDGLRPRIDGADGVLEIACTIRSLGAASIGPVEVELARGDQRLRAPLAPGVGAAWRGTLRVPQVAPWWPHTHGRPALYETTLRIGVDGRIATAVLGPVGFRTLSLAQRDGRFELAVNGVPVFCRGACWMPPDPVSLRADLAEINRTLAQVRAAGMNMLRIPGPTIYPDHTLLDGLDAHGILLWQDFMFANLDYPDADPRFDALVDAEARQLLARLQGHPALAVLCGNSEVEQQAAMSGAPRDAWTPALFHERLAALAASEAGEVPYWPSSAHGGAFPHQVDRGTTSYYGVGAYLRPFDDARRAALRFATECLGFANVPSEATLARLPGAVGARSVRVHQPAWKQRSPRDLGAGWDFDDVRDHYVARLFGIDVTRLRYADPDRYLELGRYASGAAMAAAFGEWRRAESGCGGALVWFLRDLWAGAGWGLLDDRGEPKACFRMLARMLQPVAAWLTDEGNNGLAVHLANDRPEPCAATLRLAAWRGATRVVDAERAVELAPRTVLALPVAELLEQFHDLSYAYRFGPPSHDVVVATLAAADGATRSQAFHFPDTAPATLADPQLDATLGTDADGVPRIAVRCGAVARGVHFELDGWLPDDEFFDLAPGEAREVALRKAGPEAPAAVFGAVRALNAAAATPLRRAAPKTG